MLKRRIKIVSAPNDVQLEEKVNELLAAADDNPYVGFDVDYVEAPGAESKAVVFVTETEPPDYDDLFIGDLCDCGCQGLDDGADLNLDDEKWQLTPEGEELAEKLAEQALENVVPFPQTETELDPEADASAAA